MTKIQKPSKYQIAVIEEFEQTNNSIVVKATAGSGKTTLLVHLADLIKTPNSAFVAFGREIKAELEERLPSHFTVKTVNSFFFNDLRKGLGKKYLKVDSNKYLYISLGYTSTLYPDRSTAWRAAQKMDNIIHFLNVTLTDINDENATWEMLDQYNIIVNGIHPVYDRDVYLAVMNLGEQYAMNPYQIRSYISKLESSQKELTSRIITGMGKYSERKSNWINFDEQILLPYKHNLITPHYDVILVDEVQDLPKLFRLALLKALKKSGRGVFVGDSSQSIYLFNGADTNGMQQLETEASATPLPLSISYRCPRSHIEMAKLIDNTMEWAETAKEGIINDLDLQSFVKRCAGINKSGTKSLGMGRKNVTIIRAALALLRNGIKVTVRGRNFGETLASIIKKISGKSDDFEFSNFHQELEKWGSFEYKKLIERSARETAFILLDDKIESLKILYNNFDGNSIEGFLDYIESFFDDSDTGTIILSTVHKAKGLEASITFILNPSEMPLKWKDQSEEEMRQENNILFVALTRSKDEMNFVTLGE